MFDRQTIKILYKISFYYNLTKYKQNSDNLDIRKLIMTIGIADSIQAFLSYFADEKTPNNSSKKIVWAEIVFFMCANIST